MRSGRFPRIPAFADGGFSQTKRSKRKLIRTGPCDPLSQGAGRGCTGAGEDVGRSSLTHREPFTMKTYARRHGRSSRLFTFLLGCSALAGTPALAQEAGIDDDGDAILVTGRRISESSEAIGENKVSNVVGITRDALLSAPSTRSASSSTASPRGAATPSAAARSSVMSTMKISGGSRHRLVPARSAFPAIRRLAPSSPIIPSRRRTIWACSCRRRSATTT
jgi:hypothetical protein